MYSLKINFYLRASKLNRKGEAPIYAKVIGGEKPKHVATGIFIDPKQWNSEKSLIRGNNALSKAYNDRLDLVKAKMNEKFNELKIQKGDFTADNLLKNYRGKNDKHRRTLKQAMAELILLKEREQVNGNLDRSTLNKYKNTSTHILNFLKEENLDDIFLDELLPIFIKNFELYLNKKSKSQESINKTLKQLKTCVKFSIENGWLNKDPFTSFKFKPIPNKLYYLTEEELQKIREMKIHNDHINMIKDFFIFICQTGLSYVDFKELSYHQIVMTTEGEKTIYMESRKKNKRKGTKPFYIFLNKEALVILDRYKDHWKESENLCFPVPSNQVFNRTLKDIGNLAGIKRINLSVKVGRSTFATHLLNNENNISIETVSYVLGHSNIGITQRRYAEVLAKKVFTELRKVDQDVESVSANKGKQMIQ